MNEKIELALIILLGVVGIFIVIILGIVYVSSWNRPYYILRSKGYTPRQAFLYGFGLVIIGAIAISLPNYFSDKLTESFYIPYVLWILSLTLSGYFVLAGYIRKALTRRFGNRKSKTNWQFWINLSTIVGVIIIGSVVFFSIRLFYKRGFSIGMNILTKTGSIYLGLIGIIALFKLYRKLLFKPNIEALISNDPRPPILYIRSFSLDHDAFFYGNINKNKVKQQIRQDLFAVEQEHTHTPLTFQQFFSKAFDKVIGPLIGLGDPNNYTPLEGLTTSYYEDQNWQDMFSQWVHHASCIITSPGGTAGLQFELNYILENGLANRLFIFTKPATSRFHGRFLMPLYRWMKAIEPVRWADFATNMNSFGYQVQSDELPPGSVIGFDKDGKQKLLTTRAKNPLDYVIAVLAALPR